VTDNLNHIRVLTVILTHERPEEFERCIRTAFSTLDPEDFVVVLDDSCPALSRANAAILAETGARFATRSCHIRADQLNANVARALGAEMLKWQLKTGRRDIAPLRNLSLLVSAATEPHTTVLIDDDVCGFDVRYAHELSNRVGTSEDGLITGAVIGGFTDLDTVTRLSNAMESLAKAVHDAPLSVTDLFQSPPTDDAGANEFGCVSAGFMAFQLPPTRLFAFPPGYNEDWLWCLLHRASGDTLVLRTEQVVLHRPLGLRHPSREDLLFEAAGDIIFDSICKLVGKRRTPESVIRNVPDMRLKPSVMPGARAQAALTLFQSLAKNGHGQVLNDLQDHGLTLLRELLAAGELELGDKTALRAWSSDALAKHRSFRTTIETSAVLGAVREALIEERT
jgi:hypothetical protein